MKMLLLNRYPEITVFDHHKEWYSYPNIPRRYLNKLLLLLIFTLAFTFSGCSMIGYMIGADSDRHPEVPNEVNKIKKGNEYRFITLDKKIFQGEFTGIVRMDEDEYSVRYAEKKDPLSESQYLPSIGDTISLVSRVYGKKQAIFFGFDHQSTYLNYIPANSQYASTLSNKHNFNILNANGEKITSAEIRKLISERKVAVMSEFYVSKDDDAVKIPVDNVYKVEILGRRNGRVTGFLIGFAIDAGIVVAIAQSNFPFGDEPLFSSQ